MKITPPPHELFFRFSDGWTGKTGIARPVWSRSFFRHCWNRPVVRVSTFSPAVGFTLHYTPSLPTVVTNLKYFKQNTIHDVLPSNNCIPQWQRNYVTTEEKQFSHQILLKKKTFFLFYNDRCFKRNTYFSRLYLAYYFSV